MVEKIEITSLEIPELEPYRTMKWQLAHRQRGLFVAEGEKVVRRLLQSPLNVASLLLSEEWYQELRPALQNRPEQIRVYVAEKPLLEKLTGYSMYQGVLALARVAAPATLDEMLSTNRTGATLLVAAEGVSNAENMGGLVRNCVAFNVDGLLIGETSSSPFMRRAVRSSMGTIFKLPYMETASLFYTIQELRQIGVRTIAAHPHTAQRTISQSDFRGPICIVLGAEGTGLTPEILSACDEAVVIPMGQEVDSLNVGAAGAIFLYEAARQRGRA